MQKNKILRRAFETITEKALLLCGISTGVLILFISVFLFTEGIGLFHTPDIENGYGLFVNSENAIEKLTPEETKNIFDFETTSWKAFGGEDLEITVFRIDDVFRKYTQTELGQNNEFLSEKLTEIISLDKGIIAFLPETYAPQGVHVKQLQSENIYPTDYFLGTDWIPTATPSPFFGVLPLIFGTVLVSFGAMLIAVPLALGVAIYMSELAGVRERKLMKPLIELLAGIPSVVYGFFGLVIVAPFVQHVFQLPVGETALTGSIILAVMALPTIISIAEDAIRNTPMGMREASLALGATKWQTIYKVVIPFSKSGISAAVVLGIGRAIGETMAVLMVTGNAAVMPNSIFRSVRTIPATIAAELGEAPVDGTHYQALFLLGSILFVFTMGISITAEFISKKRI